MLELVTVKRVNPFIKNQRLIILFVFQQNVNRTLKIKMR